MALADKAKQILFDALADNEGNMALAREEAIRKLIKEANVLRPAAITLIAKASREIPS